MRPCSCDIWCLTWRGWFERLRRWGGWQRTELAVSTGRSLMTGRRQAASGCDGRGGVLRRLRRALTPVLVPVITSHVLTVLTLLLMLLTCGLVVGIDRRVTLTVLVMLLVIFWFMHAAVVIELLSRWRRDSTTSSGQRGSTSTPCRHGRVGVWVLVITLSLGGWAWTRPTRCHGGGGIVIVARLHIWGWSWCRHMIGRLVVEWRWALVSGCRGRRPSRGRRVRHHGMVSRGSTCSHRGRRHSVSVLRYVYVLLGVSLVHCILVHQYRSTKWNLFLKMSWKILLNEVISDLNDTNNRIWLMCENQ